jgi:L-threonylcarbamoyladenylate synthase
VDYSALLYEALHRMEDRGVDRIVVELPPDLPEWLAVRDRLRRASWRA